MAIATVETVAIKWRKGATDGVEVGDLRVPMDYKQPDGEHITIHIRRRRAADPNRRRGVLCAVNGGPGGDTGDGAYLIDRLPEELREVYDHIGFDPRGTGHSTRLYSKVTTPLAPFDSRPSDEALEVLAADMAAREAACESTGGEFRRHVTTANTARDIDQIREALGEEKMAFVGYAFGSAVGSVYGTLFPQKLDRCVLDSCVNPEWTWRELFLAQAGAMDASVHAWTLWVADRDRAYALGTSPEMVRANVERVVSWLEGAQELTLRTLLDGLVGTDAVDRARWDSLAVTIRSLLEVNDIEQARELIAGTQTWRPQDSEGELRVGVLEAVTLETAWPKDLHVYLDDMRHHRDNFPYGYGVLRAQPWVGAFRSFGITEPVVEVTRQGYPTPLLVQSQHDPFDAYEGAVVMARRLQAPLVVVEDSGEHEIYGLTGNTAVDALVTSYLIDGQLPSAPTTSVPGASSPPEVRPDTA